MSTLRSTTPAVARPPVDRIAKLAYEKWQRSGCMHGCDLQHWIEAEKELMHEMGRTPAAATGTRR